VLDPEVFVCVVSPNAFGPPQNAKRHNNIIKIAEKVKL
jgi:hypothetical protein